MFCPASTGGSGNYVMEESSPAQPQGGRPQQVPLTLTFGDDTSPASFRAFHAHYYTLVKEANVMRGVSVWSKPDYCAVMLRLELRGATASYVEQQVQLYADLGKNDTTILDRLSSRFITADAIEIRILRFEEAAQLPGEGLSDFMTRLQQLAGQAFAKEPADVVRKRVVWRFLDGIRDKEIRSQIIKEKWMENDETAKSFAAVMKIAESAQFNKSATSATGQQRVHQGISSTALVTAGHAHNSLVVQEFPESPGQAAAIRRSTAPSINPSSLPS